MSEMSELDGLVMNNSTCKELLDTFYMLFNDFRQVYRLLEFKEKVYVALGNAVAMCKSEDVELFRLKLKNLHQLNCIIIADQKNLLKMFKALYDEHKQIELSLEIDMFKAYLNYQAPEKSTITICLEMGGFFIRYGLFHNANVFLTFAEYSSKNIDDVTLKLKIFEHLLYLDAVLHRFKKLSEICVASQTVVSETEMITEKYLRELRIRRYNNQKEFAAAVRLPGLYSNQSFLHFTRSRYDLAFRYAISAVKSLTNKADIWTILQVCCHASKAFIANQYYIEAKFFIDEAMSRAKILYPLEYKDSKFAEVLVDYAYFLKKLGKYKESQAMYVKALKIYKDDFDCRANMHIALVEKDLAETLLEGGIQKSYAFNLIEHAILCMEQFLKTGDVKKDTTMIVEAYLVKALLLIKEFKRNNPFDRKTRMLYELQKKLERKEKTVALYCGITSSLYAKYLIVLIKIDFTIGNNNCALLKSSTILNKRLGLFSKNRNLHEPIAKAEIASIIINSCEIEEYRKYVIAATQILEKCVGVIEKNVAKHSCRELEQYYQTLMDGHRKIVLHRPRYQDPDQVLDPVPFVDKYDIFKMHLVEWKRKWQLLYYNDNFTAMRNIVSSVPTIINRVKDMQEAI